MVSPLLSPGRRGRVWTEPGRSPQRRPAVLERAVAREPCYAHLWPRRPPRTVSRRDQPPRGPPSSAERNSPCRKQDALEKDHLEGQLRDTVKGTLGAQRNGPRRGGGWSRGHTAVLGHPRGTPPRSSSCGFEEGPPVVGGCFIWRAPRLLDYKVEVEVQEGAGLVGEEDGGGDFEKLHLAYPRPPPSW